VSDWDTDSEGRKTRRAHRDDALAFFKSIEASRVLTDGVWSRLTEREYLQRRAAVAVVATADTWAHPILCFKRFADMTDDELHELIVMSGAKV
jgi:hypothetical protein